jgi:hypothetical protein
MLTKRKRRLCALCRAARDNPLMQAPAHVGLPVKRAPRLYSVYGISECPDCGARWHRQRNQAVLIK